MTVYQGKLIVGGSFTSIGGVPARYIAAYDPVSNTWTEVGGGVSDEVYALGVYDGELLVGGRFMFVGPSNNQQPIGIFARWNGTQWLAPDPSQGNTLLSGGVPRAFVEFQGKLYVAGSFISAYNNQGYAYLCIWNKALQRLETAYPSGQGPNNNIWDAVVWNNALYIGGDFTSFGSATGKLVRFTGTAASTIPGAPTTGSVRKLLPRSSDLYISGSFTSAGNQTVNRVARLSTSGTWSSVGNGLGATIVSALAWYGNTLCAGGNFTTDGNGQGTLNNLASYGGITTHLSGVDAAPVRLIRLPEGYILSVEEGESPLHVRLMDMAGRAVYEEYIPSGESRPIYLPAHGLYILELRTSRKRWTSKLH